MTAEVQSGFATFQPRARLLKLIGAELISDDVVAVTELVKNAHDADASRVTVRFINVGSPDGEIVVSDDGHGMDRETLLHGWMEPAGSTKLGAGKRITPRGRRVLGEKGLGRFAADKLGQHLELISRRTGSGAEVRATFDWDQFDSDTMMLGEIRSQWELRPATEISHQGTILHIRGLRTRWTERMFRRLCTRLSRLRAPTRDRQDFSIRIESDTFPQYSGELVSEFLERAPYCIDARFDGVDGIEVKLGAGKAVRHTWSGPGSLSCGPVRVRLHAFDLETEAMAKVGSRLEVRAWLREWSGVSVYRDGFRVWPYGEPHDDWLRLDQRRVNNPVLRLSNNQVVGFVEITQDANPELRDQTNREGMVHTQALDDLRALVHHVFHLLETERHGIRHAGTSKGKARRGKEREEESNAPSVAALEKLARGLDRDKAAELRRIAAQLRERSSQEAQEKRRFVEGYSDLAAVGQAALGAADDLEAMLQRSWSAIEELRRAGASKGQSGELLGSLSDAVAAIENRLRMVSTLERGSSRRRRTMEVPVEIEGWRDLVEPLVGERGVRMKLELPRSGLLRVEMTPSAFHRVLHVLTQNSLDWLHGAAAPEVTITARAEGDSCVVLFKDNGRGIPAESAPRVFDPMFSLKDGGRGMGLTIARNIVEMHGGTIEAVVDGRMKGALMRITLPRKRSRSAHRG